MGAFDYTTNGVTMPTHAWLPGGLGKGGHELLITLQNTSKYVTK